MNLCFRKIKYLRFTLSHKKSLLTAYFYHIFDDFLLHLKQIRSYSKQKYIQFLLTETIFRKIYLFLSLNILFCIYYEKRLTVLNFLTFYLTIIYTYMFWKRKVSQNIRGKISYSGYEDADGWIIIDNVELYNEPDDRAWKVISTCGNVAKFVLLLRRKSYSKFTFVVVPSCVASAMLGRYVPGVVLFHLASMSLITWPYLSFIPFLFYDVSKFGCKHLLRYVSRCFPKSYYSGVKGRIALLNKAKSPKSITEGNENDSKESKENRDEEQIASSKYFSWLLAAFKFPTNYFTALSGTQTTDLKSQNTDEHQPKMHSYEDLDTDMYVYEFLPELDERAAFILEEASEALSSSTESLLLDNDNIEQNYRKDKDSLRMDFTQKKEERKRKEKLRVGHEATPDFIPRLYDRGINNKNNRQYNIRPNSPIEPCNDTLEYLDRILIEDEDNTVMGDNMDKCSISSNASSYVRDLADQNMNNVTHDGDSSLSSDENSSKQKKTQHKINANNNNNIVIKDILSQNFMDICYNINDSIHAWAHMTRSSTSKPFESDQTSQKTTLEKKAHI